MKLYNNKVKRRESTLQGEPSGLPKNSWSKRAWK